MRKVEIYKKIRDCSKVGLHGWYNSSVGIIRKPNSKINLAEIVEPPIVKPLKAQKEALEQLSVQKGMTNKEVFINRGKSFLWRLGAYVVVTVLAFLADNLGLIGLPPTVVAIMATIIALVVGEITKYLNVDLKKLKITE